MSLRALQVCPQLFNHITTQPSIEVLLKKTSPSNRYCPRYRLEKAFDVHIISTFGKAR